MDEVCMKRNKEKNIKKLRIGEKNNRRKKSSNNSGRKVENSGFHEKGFDE